MRLETRLECLKTLKEIGFQTGAGFMVGSPYQTDEFIAEDIMFLQDFKPHMIGIGPFLPHKDTPFRDEKGGSVLKTLIILAIVRLTNPLALLPPQPLFATAEPGGRERGILAGANVVMPNLSPANVREKYLFCITVSCVPVLRRRKTNAFLNRISQKSVTLSFRQGATVRLPVEKTVDTRRLNVVQCKVFL